MENTVLIMGATGTIGREAARAVAAEGGKVRALVRTRQSAAKLEPDSEIVLGDLRAAASVERALSGVRAALYISPHEPDEVALAEHTLRACEAARVRLVFIGVHVDAPTRLGRALRRSVFGLMLPHYKPKFALAERARQRGATVIMASNLYQNDELFRPEILAGSFPQAFEKRLNRVDARDVGLASARALLDAQLPVGAYPVYGPSSLSGADCAAEWSRVLERDMHCERDHERLNAALARELSGKKRDDFLATYAALRRMGMATSEAAIAQTTRLLGRAPTSYASYVRDTATRWNVEAQRLPVASARRTAS